MDTGGEGDRAVREQIKKKDYEYIARMKKEMQVEEQELKQYFQKASMPVKEDPSFRSKIELNIERDEAYKTKMGLFKEAFDSFQIFHFWSGFWKYKASTP